MEVSPFRRALAPILMLLTIGLLIIALQQFSPSEKKYPQSLTLDTSQPVTVAVICPKTDELEAYTLLADLAEKDINNYMVESGLPIRYVFEVGDAQGESKKAYDLAIEHYNSGHELIVGLSWSSQMDVFFSFAQENGALIISPGSAQPWPWRLAPLTYRLNPANHLYSIPIAKAIESLNITSVVILQQNKNYPKPIKEQFISEYNGNIETVFLETGYSDEEIQETVDVLLKEIQEASKDTGPKHVAVYYIGFSQILSKVLKTTTSDALFDVPWFVSSWYTWDEDPGTKYGYFNNTLKKLTEIKLIGAFPNKPDNQVYHRVNDYYTEALGVRLSMIHGNLYDGLWLTALSIAEVESINGDEVGKVIPSIAKNYVGVTGNCSFNEWGDRWGVDWTLLGYEIVDSETIVKTFGLYNCSTREIIWYNNPKKTS